MFIENLFCVIILAMTAFAVFYFFVNVVFDCDFGWYTIEKILYKMKKKGLTNCPTCAIIKTSKEGK